MQKKKRAEQNTSNSIFYWKSASNCSSNSVIWAVWLGLF